MPWHQTPRELSRNAEERPLLLEKFKPPTWEADDQSNECYACNLEFNLTKRRHHCRRCGNVFCGKCSEQRIRLLLFSIVEPARVCDGCFRDACDENDFVDKTIPRLRSGTTFTLRNALFGGREGTLQLNRHLTDLEFRDANNGSVDVLPLRSVEDVKSVSASKGCLIVLVDSNGRKKEYKFDGADARESRAWVSAVLDASKRAIRPTISQEVEAARKKRKTEKAYQAYKQSSEQRRESNQVKRSELAKKYGIER